MDTLTPSARSERMRRIKAKGSRAEKAVRSLLHREKYRFRLHRRDLPGTPDLVFPSRRAVIFVHGCFWHRHADPNCKLSRLPKSGLEFWLPKLDRNAERDAEHLRELRDLGWRSAIVWECELRDMERVGNELRSFLENGSEHEGG